MPSQSGRPLNPSDPDADETGSARTGEEPFRSAFEQASVGIVHAAPDGRFLRVNQRFCELVGYSRQELVAQTFQDITHPDDLGAELAYIQGLLAKRRSGYAMDKRYVRKDGSAQWVNVTGSVVCETSGEPSWLVTVVRSIADHELMEEALWDRDERYLQLFNASPDGIVLIDPDGRIVDANITQARMYRYDSPSDLVGVPAPQLVAPSSRAHSEQIMRRRLNGEDVPPVEYELLRRDGTTFYGETSATILRKPGGSVLGYICVTRDTTQRRQAAEALRVSQETALRSAERLQMVNQIGATLTAGLDFEQLMRTIHEQCRRVGVADTFYVALYDDVSGLLSFPFFSKDSEELTIASRSLRDTPGVTAHVIAQGRSLIIPDLHHPPAGIAPVYTSGPPTRSYLGVPLVLDGRVVGVLSMQSYAINAYTAEQLATLELLAVQAAIAVRNSRLYADLEAAYNKLRETQRAVMQEERLRALGEMASGIAHDINNAISPILLYAGLIEARATLDDQSKAFLRTIQTATRDVEETVGRMRQFYRKREEEDHFPVNINLAVQQAIDLTRPRWRDIPQRQGIIVDLRTDFAVDLPFIMGNAAEIRQVVTNLILNAIDAMPKGGTLTLRAYGEAAPYARVILEVIDTGTGMDEETQKRAFEPFFSTKGERGSGMGLSLVHGTMRRHGGDVQLVSAVGAGTLVRLSFPVSELVAETLAPAEPKPLRLSLRILVVDDEPLLRQVLKDVLEGEGHGVESADGGQSGLDAFREARKRGEPFEVVITDLGMPYVDGRTVARSVKAEAPETPVIMLTGWGNQLGPEDSLLECVDQILSKPPTIEALKQALARVTSLRRPQP